MPKKLLRSLSKVAILTCILQLSGCGVQQPATPESVYRETTVEFDPYKNVTQIKGPTLEQHDQYPLIDTNLRAFAVGKNILFYQLYVDVGIGNWAFYDSARSSDGNNLIFNSIDRIVSQNGSVNEIFGITLSREQLNKAKESGLNFKAVGKRRSTIISIPNSQFVGFLRKVDDYENQ